MRIVGLEKSFGRKKVLSSLNLNLDEHTLTVLMGASGCGKTTLFKIIVGLERPDGGIVETEGRVSALFQEDRLIKNLSVLKNLMLVTDNRDRAMAFLSDLGLADEAKTKACNLSGGMARRVALARSLLSAFDTLVVDEPFSGLDLESKKLAAGILLKETKDKTVLLTTHDSDDLVLLGNPPVVYMNHGGISYPDGL